MEITVKEFGMVNNVTFDEIRIEKEGEFIISFSDLGARINSWQVPNTKGKLEPIVLGFDDAQHAFEGATYNYGATIGRVAGRIADGKFQLKNETYTLPKNNGENHLHGGYNSFDLQKWDYSIEEKSNQVNIIFKLMDKDGTNGYPGNLSIQVTHTITTNNEWIISYQATADETTLFNPTNHVYFNLNGDVEETIENHIIEIKAEQYLPIDETNIPLGKYANVKNTPFDLRTGKRFSDLMQTDDTQFNLHKGFDHPFLLEKDLEYQGVISVPERNRQLFFKTDEPTVVVYTHNYTPFETKIWGQPLKRYSGLALETQKEPDAINQTSFSSIILEKDHLYVSQTKYWLKNNPKGAE